MVLTKEGEKEIVRMLMPKPETTGNNNIGWAINKLEYFSTPNNSKPEKRADYTSETLKVTKEQTTTTVLPISTTRNSFILNDTLTGTTFSLKSIQYNVSEIEAVAGAVIPTENIKVFQNNKIKEDVVSSETINIIIVININQK